MDASVRSALDVEATSAVSWASIAAGAAAAAALSLALFGLGAGLGLSSISPWAGSGVSASTFKTAAGIYLVLVAVMSSALGGYLAARLPSSAACAGPEIRMCRKVEPAEHEWGSVLTA